MKPDKGVALKPEVDAWGGAYALCVDCRARPAGEIGAFAFLEAVAGAFRRVADDPLKRARWRGDKVIPSSESETRP